jgi:hypothetical protein
VVNAKDSRCCQCGASSVIASATGKKPVAIDSIPSGVGVFVKARQTKAVKTEVV